MKKRIFTLLLAIMIFASAFAFPSTVSAAEAVYDVDGWVPEVGDIDGDGNVATLRDLMCLARYLDNWNGYEDIYVKAADLNGDGLYATLADMYYLERYLAKWSGYTFGVSTEGDAEETTTAGETLPLYARFDFGTDTKAEDLNYTTHEWLVSALSYNRDNINVEFTEDSVIVTALRNHGNSTAIDKYGDEYLVSDRWAFSLTFNDIISYDFNNSLVPGFGSWANAPYVKPSADTRWVGKHQYMQIRMRNFTDNNIISVGYSKAVGSFATTQIASALYLQGGEPATADKTGKTAPIDTSWKVYTYDMNFQSHICRNLAGSYAEMVENVVVSPNGCGGNNWNWFNGAEIVGLRFDFLGSQSRTNYINYQADYYLCDTREYITAGDKVEVDYVIFGSGIEQLDSYLSYAEESSLYGDTLPETTAATTTAATTLPEFTTWPLDEEVEIPDYSEFNGESKLIGYEDVDFGGRVFTIAGSKNDLDMDTYKEIYDEDASDAIASSVNNRNKLVEDLYNCSIAIHKSASPSGDAMAEVAANAHTIDLYTQMYPNTGLYTSDQNYNFYDLGMDFTGPWWDEAWVDSFTIRDNSGNKKMYAAVGDFSLASMRFTSVLYFNSSYDSSLTGEIYDLVYNGKWTIDEFVRIYKSVKTDANGDGSYAYADGDMLGYVKSTLAARALTTGQDLLIVKNINGSLQFNPAYETRRWENGVAAAWDAYTAAGTETLGYVDVEEAFATGKALFATEILCKAEYWRNLDMDVSVVPHPKASADQENYMSYVDNHVSSYSMPISVPDPETVATFFELYAAHSMPTVRETFESTYSLKYFSTPDDENMLDIVLDSRAYDLGYYWWSVYDTDIMNMIQSGKLTVPLWATRKYEALNTSMQEFVDNISKNIN